MLKYLTLWFAFSLPSILSCGQEVPLPAENILKDACQEATESGKNIFIIFHASWCGWCHKLDSSLNAPCCKKFFRDHYVIRHLVVFEYGVNKNNENPGAEELLRRYGGADEGIPFWLIFSPDGKLLADAMMHSPVSDGSFTDRNCGCPASPEEIDYFIGVLRKTAKLAPEEETLIRRRFAENDH